jgi:SSS family solute:Na+ symporter
MLNWLDVSVFVLFFAVVVSVSMFKSRREKGHEKGSEDYFLGGRGLIWPLIGISIVAANISTEQFVGMAGQGAGAVGLAVSNWQLFGSVGIVLISFTLLPRFLKAGIYTMPEYLEYRYNKAARSIMAVITLVIYVVVLLTAVLYSGGLTLSTIFGLDIRLAVWVIGIIAALYTAWGGLKAVAWADLFQGVGLLLGGLLTFYLGLKACGGWEAFASSNADSLHMILPADHPDLPWTGVILGMPIVLIYYCGLNQFIVQRNLAARTLRDGQLGMILAGALWLLVPFAIVMPGIMSVQLFGDQITNSDQAFPTLIRELIPLGVRGFIFAALAGAVVSSLASMLNSAATIFTMDVYKPLNPDAPQDRLVLTGRVLTLVFVVIGCLMAPQLANPEFKGVFNFIQNFQGYIWPGVVAAFVVGMLLKRAPEMSGAVVLVAGPAIYYLFQTFTGIHFLVQVAITFLILCMIMLVMTLVNPLPAAKTLPVREDMDLRTERVVYVTGALVIAAVALFYIVFW